MRIQLQCIGILVAVSLASPAVLRAADDAKPDAPARRANAPTANPLAGLKTAIDDLKLAGETKTKVDGILAKAQTDIDQATRETAGDRRAGFRKVAEIVKSAGDQITPLLDEDQKLMLRSKLQAASANEPAAGGGGAGGPGAPGAGRGGQMIAQRIKDVTATLGLSDDQTTKVDAAVADLQKKAEELRAAGAGPEMREKLMALREDGMKQIKAILTEEQFTRFQEAIRQAPAGGPAGGRIGAMVQRFQDAIKDLNLTEDQKPKVDAALADARKKLAALAPSVQGGQPNPDVREKFRTAMEDLRTELMGVLTPEQQEKFRASVQQGAGGPGAGSRPRPGAGAEKPAGK
jgi:Spy/CpxP family protein refolding chaperone